MSDNLNEQYVSFKFEIYYFSQQVGYFDVFSFVQSTREQNLSIYSAEYVFRFISVMCFVRWALIPQSKTNQPLKQIMFSSSSSSSSNFLALLFLPEETII